MDDAEEADRLLGAGEDVAKCEKTSRLLDLKGLMNAKDSSGEFAQVKKLSWTGLTDGGHKRAEGTGDGRDGTLG